MCSFKSVVTFLTICSYLCDIENVQPALFPALKNKKFSCLHRMKRSWPNSTFHRMITSANDQQVDSIRCSFVSEAPIYSHGAPVHLMYVRSFKTPGPYDKTKFTMIFWWIAKVHMEGWWMWSNINISGSWTHHYCTILQKLIFSIAVLQSTTTVL